MIRKNPDVRDTAIVAFADRRTGVGLYAFVEADKIALEKQLRSELSAAKGVKPPEHIQVVHALPRDAAGKPRTEILQLVAMNQLDLIEPMMKNEADRAFLKDILESRKNLRDRFNFESIWAAAISFWAAIFPSPSAMFSIIDLSLAEIVPLQRALTRAASAGETAYAMAAIAVAASNLLSIGNSLFVFGQTASLPSASAIVR